jgi:Protein of unknown function (DUF2752)
MDHAHLHEPASRAPWLGRWFRVDGRVFGSVLAALLALAATLPLVPFYPGFACPLRTLTGIPCPFCGTSTSIQETLRFDLPAAFEANPGGIIAVLTALALILFRPRVLKVPVAGLAALLAAMWVFELNRFGML